MPISKPKADETHDDFISRCASEMSGEFEGDQLVAVCEQAWKDAKESKALDQGICRRAFEIDDLRVEKREGEDGADAEPSKLVGHAAVFNAEVDFGWHRETIAPGAFTEAVKEDDVRALFNHDPNFPLGRTKSNTLRLWEDDRGLGVEIDLPDTTQANDLRTSIDRGDISQMSFAFRPVIDEWDHTNEESPLRTLKEVRLFDVSPVTYPAYDATDVSARAYQVEARTSLEASRKAHADSAEAKRKADEEAAAKDKAEQSAAAAESREFRKAQLKRAATKSLEDQGLAKPKGKA